MWHFGGVEGVWRLSNSCTKGLAEDGPGGICLGHKCKEQDRLVEIVGSGDSLLNPDLGGPLELAAMVALMELMQNQLAVYLGTPGGAGLDHSVQEILGRYGGLSAA